MPAYRIEATIAEDGSVVLKDLPLPPGARVEILVLSRPDRISKDRYPLRGTPVSYREPTEPVAEEDWEALP